MGMILECCEDSNDRVRFKEILNGVEVRCYKGMYNSSYVVLTVKDVKQLHKYFAEYIKSQEGEPSESPVEAVSSPTPGYPSAPVQKEAEIVTQARIGALKNQVEELSARVAALEGQK